jgi:hypothetical protein
VEIQEMNLAILKTGLNLQELQINKEWIHKEALLKTGLNLQELQINKE